jgi:hypothetical protein
VKKMIEVLSHPITLLCLGVIFVLSALLFFYFKRSMMVIEQAQMEQATVLRNFIASMEMRKHEFSQPMSGLSGSVKIQRSSPQEDSLIDVSDNEMKDNDSTEDNAYETESDSDDSEYSSTSEVPDNDTIKVINVEDLDDLKNTYSEYSQKESDKHLDTCNFNDIDESASTSCDDMFSTDLDKMEMELEIESNNVGSISELDMNSLAKTSFIRHSKETTSNSVSSTANGNIEQFDQMSILLSHEDFKGYTVSQIREYALHRNIISKGDKMKKKELVDYVIEANIEGGAEHLKVNKVGAAVDIVDPDEVVSTLHQEPEDINRESLGEETLVGNNQDLETEKETDNFSDVIKAEVETEVEQYVN